MIFLVPDVWHLPINTAVRVSSLLVILSVSLKGCTSESHCWNTDQATVDLVHLQLSFSVLTPYSVYWPQKNRLQAIRGCEWHHINGIHWINGTLLQVSQNAKFPPFLCSQGTKISLISADTVNYTSTTECNSSVPLKPRRRGYPFQFELSSEPLKVIVFPVCTCINNSSYLIFSSKGQSAFGGLHRNGPHGFEHLAHREWHY